MWRDQHATQHSGSRKSTTDATSAGDVSSAAALMGILVNPHGAKTAPKF